MTCRPVYLRTSVAVRHPHPKSLARNVRGKIRFIEVRTVVIIEYFENLAILYRRLCLFRSVDVDGMLIVVVQNVVPEGVIIINRIHPAFL